ncbi:lipase b precursor [Colletotrichum tofieldiae]|nr:lipase b precursor [Colletotrichum tofieldiae]
MKSTYATAISLVLWRTNVVARPISDQTNRATPDVANSNQTAVIESQPLEPDVQALNKFLGNGMNSIKNVNPEPKTQIYPKRSDSDAPYSLSEQELRSKIYFPKTFSSSSNKQPVILIPGTAAMAGSTYRANLGPLLAESDFADPLWVNIPDASLSDAQKNSEYVAYAINYVQSSTGKKPAVVAWSQGNLNVQWALKYWPSTRDAVTDLVAMSPDFHGTKEAFLACKTAAAIIGCTPSVYQQMYDSQFVRTLRAKGGDSAYAQRTKLCNLSLAQKLRPFSKTSTELTYQTSSWGVVTHEGMLYNSLAFALLKDALMNEGPGKLERIDKNVCGDPAAGKLDKIEIKATEAVLGDAAINVLKYPNKVKREPAIKDYAKQ